MPLVLDTNIIVFRSRGKSPLVSQRLHTVPTTEVRVPLQVHAELLVGTAKSASPGKSLAKVNAFITPFELIYPDQAIEGHYVASRVHLERAGTLISEGDLWIAATARALSGTLITNNIGEFSRVPDLLIADWTRP